MVQVKILNCNNIKKALLPIEHNKLNIFYGANGTGKSTMARAIVEAQKENPNYTPFIPYSQPSMAYPAVTSPRFSKVMLFNDDYINGFAYQKDSVIKDAFEIFVRTPEYDRINSEIGEALANLRSTFIEDSALQILLTKIRALLDHIKLNKDGTLAKTGVGVRSILAGKGKIFDPPEPLTAMSPFFDDTRIVGWATWRMQGQNEYGQSGICPFCATADSDATRAVAEAFIDSFDKHSVTFASGVKSALEPLLGFILEEKRTELLSLFGEKERVDTLRIKLAKLGVEASGIRDKLDKLMNFNAFRVERQSIRNLDTILNSMRMDPAAYDEFFSGPLMKEVIARIDLQIDGLIAKVGDLKRLMGQYQSAIASKVKDREKDINDLLKSAGFNYQFVIHTTEDAQAHAVLKYILPTGNMTTTDVPAENLSWGERHAFAMIMFMFDAIRCDADLIILDDPISSFDSSKKYALMHRLFLTRHHNRSLYQRTVIMLTHDFQPIIDYIQVGGKAMDSTAVCAYFCQNLSGTIYLKGIRRDADILSTVMLMGEIARDSKLDIAVRIGCLRKFIEHTEHNFQKNPVYNVLSSLIHGRSKPSSDNQEEHELTPDEIKTGVLEIRKFITDFDYDIVLDECQALSLLDRYTKVTNAYERLMLIRMYCEQQPDARQRLGDSNDVLRKYVDETFHIENDYMYMLDIRKFDIVPQHIDEQANDFVRSEMEKQQLL